MMTRSLIGVTSLIVVVGLAGCGPTAYGKKMRQEANDRLSLVNADIAYDQAQRSYEVGQFDRALREIDEAIARAPSQPDYFVLRGRILIETHKLEAALQSLRVALELDENSPKAHYFAGIVFERWSDDQRAYEHFSKAMKADASNGQYLLATAEALIALGQFDEARTLVDAKMDYFEHNAALHHLMAQISHLQGDPVEAAGLYAEARLLRPDDMLLLEELAWVQFEAEQYHDCLESVEELQDLSLEPRDDLVHLQARCLALLERTTEARDLYEQLTRERPSDPEVWFALGLISRELGDYRRVALSSVRVLALAPQRYEGYMLKGMNERHKGNLDEAIALFREACDRSTAEPLPFILLGQCLEETRDARGALAAYSRAEQVDPGNDVAAALIYRLSDVADASGFYPTDDP